MDRYRLLLHERLANFREWVEGRSSWRFELVLTACLVVGLSAIICSEYLPSFHGFRLDAPAPRTVVAERTVTVLDVEATNELRAEVANLVEPVYVPDSEALPRATADLTTFFRQAELLRREVEAGTTDPDEAVAALQGLAPESLSVGVAEYLLTTDSSTFAQIESQSLGALRTLFAGRITDRTVDQARLNLRAIANALAASQSIADAVYEATANYVRPNQVVDEEQTLQRRRQAMEQVAPVTTRINRGDTVIREGEIATGQDLLILEALGLTEGRTGWRVWLGIVVLVIMETALFSRLLRRFNKAVEGFGNNMLLALVILLLLATGVARLLSIAPLSAYLIPSAALGMTSAVILNARSALLQVALLSLNIGMITGFELKYALISLLVGGLSLYLVSRVTKRSTIMAVGLTGMFIAAIAIFAVELATGSPAGTALRESVWGFGNGFFAGLVTIPLLMVFETVFNLTTPLRLLELADPAHPLLKRLLQVAPGTYNHSIQMGNLAEAAAEAIGANPLLARVGAYYHDIGKTARPEYFVENQIYVENPHDHLSPNLSKLAITAHVRDGEHLAKVHGLPQPIVDIIKQHHGTSVLAYFFHKARESGGEPVYEESYRYEEQKPRSKEAAIIMLADSVEAAVRAMEKPTRRKIQGVIQEIIRQKVQDGQLDESELTQGDLHKIQESFDLSLLGLVGHRIKYPEAEERAEGQAGRPPGSPPRRRPPSALVPPRVKVDGQADGAASAPAEPAADGDRAPVGAPVGSAARRKSPSKSERKRIQASAPPTSSRGSAAGRDEPAGAAEPEEAAGDDR